MSVYALSLLSSMGRKSVYKMMADQTSLTASVSSSRGRTLYSRVTIRILEEEFPRAKHPTFPKCYVLGPCQPAMQRPATSQIGVKWEIDLNLVDRSQ
jgi:hypothetical protein